MRAYLLLYQILAGHHVLFEGIFSGTGRGGGGYCCFDCFFVVYDQLDPSVFSIRSLSLIMYSYKLSIDVSW